MTRAEWLKFDWIEDAGGEVLIVIGIGGAKWFTTAEKLNAHRGDIEELRALAEANSALYAECMGWTIPLADVEIVAKLLFKRVAADDRRARTITQRCRAAASRPRSSRYPAALKKAALAIASEKRKMNRHLSQNSLANLVVDELHTEFDDTENFKVPDVRTVRRWMKVSGQ